MRIFLDDRLGKEFLAYCETIRQRLKSLGRELESKEKLFQLTLQSWRTYHDLFEKLERWLKEGDEILRRPSSEEKFQHFASIDRWAVIHKELHQAMEYLISVCDQEIVTQLQNRVLFLNRRWKETIDEFQHFQHDELIRKKRDEFYSARTNILETLEKIIQEIQQNLPCSAKALKEQENRLIVSFRLSIFVSKKTFFFGDFLGRPIGFTNGSKHNSSVNRFESTNRSGHWRSECRQRNEIVVRQLFKSFCSSR